jgi:hypothetical protein
MMTELSFIGISFLLFLSLYIYLLGSNCDETVEWVGNIFFSFIFAFLSVAGLVFLDQKETSTTYEYYCKIHSLKNSNDVSGSFVLGSGNIEQVEYYYYYYKDINGYFKRGKKKVNNTVIEERENTTPRIERKYTQYKSRTGIVESYSDGSTEEYKIVVPKGTVISKFEIY